MDVIEIEKSERAAEALMPKEGRIVTMKLLDESGQLVDCEFIQATCGIGYLNIFFNQVRREVKNFVSGDYGIKLGELFRGEIAAPNVGELVEENKVDDFVEENAQIIEALLKLVEIAPGFTYDVIALSLGVPRRRIEWFKDAVQEPPHRGGLTTREYVDLLVTFVRQNRDEIRDFFGLLSKDLVGELQLVMGAEGDGEGDLSTGGTRSSTSSPAILESASMTS